MALDLGLDPTGELILGNGDLTVVKDQHVVAQRIRVRLVRQLGDWPLDTTLGIPWMTELLKRGSVRLMESLTLREISTTPDVTEILEFKSESLADRQLSVTFRALTPFGVINGGST
jgi:hypothetical protein